MPDATSATTTERQAFGALSVRGYPMFLFTFFMTMMADNVEHVISYWVAFQKFHSAALQLRQHQLDEVGEAARHIMSNLARSAASTTSL